MNNFVYLMDVMSLFTLDPSLFFFFYIFYHRAVLLFDLKTYYL